MLAVFNPVNGAPVQVYVANQAAAAVPPAPIQGGQMIVQVYWVPPQAPGAHGGQQPPNNWRERCVCVIHTIHTLTMYVFDAIKAVFDDVNSSVDLLKLATGIIEYCEENKQSNPTLRLVAGIFSCFTGANSVRSAFNRFRSAFSGEAATQEAFEAHYDWLRVANKLIFLINDVISSMKWLHEIGFTSIKKIEVINFFGRSIGIRPITTGITVVGSLCNLVDNIRLIAKYAFYREDTPKRARIFKCISASIDSLSDISRIASSILFAIPTPQCKIAAITVNAAGNALALLKFGIDRCTKASREREKADIDRILAVAYGRVLTELQTAATALHQVSVANECIALLQHELQEAAKNPGVIQLQISTVVAQNLLVRAIAASPAAPPLPPLPIMPGAAPIVPIARHQLTLALQNLLAPAPPLPAAVGQAA